MPLISTLQAGSTANPVISRKNYNLTIAKTDELITAFIHDWAGPMPDGLTAQQQGEWKLKQAHQKIVDYFQAEVKRNSIKMAEPQVETIKTQVDTSSTLPTPTEE